MRDIIYVYKKKDRRERLMDATQILYHLKESSVFTQKTSAEQMNRLLSITL